MKPSSVPVRGRLWRLFLAGGFCVTATLPLEASAKSSLLYSGTYTSQTSRGIYAWRFDDTSGALTPLGLAAETPQPAHVWVSPNGRFLYAVNWEREGGVSAFRIDPANGHLTFLNRVSSEGASPNQIVLDPSGRIAVTVNYASGSLAAYRVPADGRLSDAFFVERHTDKPISPRQPNAKMHGLQFSRDGRFLYAADLGLDRIYVYRVDAAKAAIVPASPAYFSTHAGAGPRRLQLSPNGRFLYVCHETDSEVSVFAVDGASLQEIQTISTLPAGTSVPNTTAEIILDRRGRHLYVSNRGHDTVAIFAVDPASGRLTLQANAPAGGRTPRNLRMDPSGRYLLSANEDGGNITVLKVDPATGLLSAPVASVEINRPGGLYFVPEK